MNRLTIILIIASLLIGEIFTGGFFCGKGKTTAVAPSNKKDSVKAVHIVHTEVVYKTKYFEGPGKIVYVPVPGEDNTEKVACWDSASADGFYAEVRYSITRNVFRNKFILPEKTIHDIDSILVYSENVTTNIKNELPQWQLGIGVKTFYQDKLQYFPNINLTFNQKVWFMYFSIEGKALTQFESGGIKMIPELDAKLKFSL